MPFAAIAALAGFLLFWAPYRLTGWIVDRLHRPEDQRSTYKLLVGIVLYAVWVLALAVIGAVAVDGRAGLGLLLGVPAVGMMGLVIRERWRGAWGDAQRFLLLRTRRALVDALRTRQHELGVRLDALYQVFATRGAS